MMNARVLFKDHVLLLNILVLCSFTIGCKNDEAIEVKNQNNASTKKSSYSTRGYVLELISDDQSTFIHHEQIPDFMEEMTMYLKVEDQEEYSKLKVGHQYTFDMIVNRDDGTYIENIIPTGAIKADSFSKEKPSEKWFKKPTFELGDKLPEFSLKTSDGEILNASKLSGAPWAITFIFTRCPLPDFCPMMSLRFNETVNLLQESEINNWNLVSLTIDPVFDTEKILNGYKKARGYEYDNWFFCRAEIDEVKKIGDPLGLSFDTEGFPIEHNLRTAVFDADGKLVEVFSGNKWTAQELAESIIGADKGT